MTRHQFGRFGLLGGFILKSWLLLAVFVLTVLHTGKAEAQRSSVPVLLGWGGEKSIKIRDFPDIPDFQDAEGYYIDAGIIYKQATIFFIPVWNYDRRWIGFIDGSDEYYELSRTELENFASLANVSLPENFQLPFWDSYGGKLVFLLGIILLILWMNSVLRDEIEEKADQENQNG